MGQNNYEDEAQSILDILSRENRRMTFDELYELAKPDCDWVTFASQLELLVEQGAVKHILPAGADVGFYEINSV